MLFLRATKPRSGATSVFFLNRCIIDMIVQKRDLTQAENQGVLQICLSKKILACSDEQLQNNNCNDDNDNHKHLYCANSM